VRFNDFVVAKSNKSKKIINNSAPTNAIIPQNHDFRMILFKSSGECLLFKNSNIQEIIGPIT